MKKVLVFFSALLFLLTQTIAQSEKRIYYADEELTPREHLVDFTHLRLEVEFEPVSGKVEGTVTHSFTVLREKIDSLFLDAVDIQVKGILLNGKTVPYSSTSTGIVVRFDVPLSWESKHQLKIDYHAYPKKGIYFIGWNDPAGASRKQIWTQGQGIDNRHWIPMYDSPNDKVITELVVTFQQGYEVLSNGRKMSEKNNKDGSTTWHYLLKKPHPTYLIMLGIGDYNIKTVESKSGVPLHLWYYPDWESRVASTYLHSAKIMDYMEEETGFPYPWGSYSQIPVQDFMYGAMENTSATIFGDFYFTDEAGFYDRNYVRVNAHELAHQWFGNLVTARSSAHHWLQESFATHYDLSFQGVAFGVDHFNWERRKAQNQAIAESKKDFKPLAHSGAGTVRHYPKGAHVLQMLKYVVGKPSFNKAIHYYLNKHQFQNVDSKDLLVAFHESLGLSLDWFWEEWIYKGGEPAYNVEFKEETVQGKRIGRFDVTQTHEQNEFVGLFDMPMVFEVHYQDGNVTSQRIRIHEQHQTVLLPLEKGKKIDFVLFDPNNEVMKSVQFDKPQSMLFAQAEHAKSILDRYDAVVELADVPVDDKRALLHQLFQQESFFAVKEAILQQLLYDVKSQDLVKKAVADPDPLVRTALINLSGFIPQVLLSDYEQLLLDSSYVVVEQSLHKLCFLFPNNTEKYLEMTKDLHGIHSKNVRIKWLEIAYQTQPSTPIITELVELTSPSHEFRTRVAAAEALQRLNHFDREVLENCIQALFSFNSRLRGPINTVLLHFYEQDAHKKTIYDYVSDTALFDATERQRLRRFMHF
jgi:aminopeptidase N